MEDIMYKAILFDLDGTLTESGEGITKSVQYALEKLGKPEEDLEKLKVFIGPPPMEQFMKYADLDEETARKAVEYYRERYSEKGIFENRPYPGVEDMLKELKRKKYRFRESSLSSLKSFSERLSRFSYSLRQTLLTINTSKNRLFRRYSANRFS